MLRKFKTEDFRKLKEIHEKYYTNEFPFPNLDSFMSFLISTDHNGELIAAGGVRSIAEIITITDKDKSPVIRGRCLMELLNHGRTVASSYGYDQLYSHVEGANWVRAHKIAGFKQFKAVPLVLNTRERQSDG